MITFLSVEETARRVGKSKWTVVRWGRDPEHNFPAPVRTGPNSLAFVESEVELYQKACIADRGAVANENEPDIAAK